MGQSKLWKISYKEDKILQITLFETHDNEDLHADSDIVGDHERNSCAKEWEKHLGKSSN